MLSNGVVFAPGVNGLSGLFKSQMYISESLAPEGKIKKLDDLTEITAFIFQLVLNVCCGGLLISFGCNKRNWSQDEKEIQVLE